MVSGCSDGVETDAPGVEETFIDEAEPPPFDPSDPTTLSGVSTAENLIGAGECFNHYQYFDQSDFLQQVTTIVDCGSPHDREAYFVVDYPAGDDEAYPLDDELKRWSQEACFDEFEAFVGEEYVLSLLEIGTVIPNFERWNDDGDRTVICYVFPDQGGRLLESVRNSGI